MGFKKLLVFNLLGGISALLLGGDLVAAATRARLVRSSEPEFAELRSKLTDIYINDGPESSTNSQLYDAKVCSKKIRRNVLSLIEDIKSSGVYTIVQETITVCCYPINGSPRYVLRVRTDPSF